MAAAAKQSARSDSGGFTPLDSKWCYNGTMTMGLAWRWPSWCGVVCLFRFPISTEPHGGSRRLSECGCLVGAVVCFEFCYVCGAENPDSA